MSHSPSDNYETQHDSNRPAGTAQSGTEAGNLGSVPAHCPEATPYRINPAWEFAEYGFDFSALNELHRACLRGASFERACRSGASVLCASTDADDALACVVAACRAACETEVRAIVADCLSNFYPRSDPRKLHEIAARVRNPARRPGD